MRFFRAALPLLLTGTIAGAGAWAAPAGQSPEAQVQGEARIVRGRVRRARYLATEQALHREVWRQARRLMAKVEAAREALLTKKLRREARKLTAWFRTRKIVRTGRTLRVRLAVRVDLAALRARLRSLGVPLKVPGVLLTVACGSKSVGPALVQALGRVGIRVVLARTSPGAGRSKLAVAAAFRVAREQLARAVLEVRCTSRTAGRIDAAGVVAVEGQVEAAVHVPSAAGRATHLLTRKEKAFAHDRLASQAAEAAQARAATRLAAVLAGLLPGQLPSGVARLLRLRVTGSLRLAELQALMAEVRRTGTGVISVAPRRFRRRETWIGVRTTRDRDGLKQALDALKPPTGFRMTVALGLQSDALDVKLQPTEEP